MCALAACFGTALALRGSWTSPLKITILGLDPQGLGISALAVIAAVIFFGPVFGICIILVIVIHEFGHVAAFRVAGHHDASFRLVPLMGGYAISNRAVDTQEEDVFIILMGPAICLAPMLLAYALVLFATQYFPAAVSPLYTFSGIAGALNFFNPVADLAAGRGPSYGGDYIRVPRPRAVLHLCDFIRADRLDCHSGAIPIHADLRRHDRAAHDPERGRRWLCPVSAYVQEARVICLGAWLFTAAALFMGGFSTILRFV